MRLRGSPARRLGPSSGRGVDAGPTAEDRVTYAGREAVVDRPIADGGDVLAPDEVIDVPLGGAGFVIPRRRAGHAPADAALRARGYDHTLLR